MIFHVDNLPGCEVKYHTEDASAIAGREFEACSGPGEMPIQSRLCVKDTLETD